MTLGGKWAACAGCRSKSGMQEQPVGWTIARPAYYLMDGMSEEQNSLARLDDEKIKADLDSVMEIEQALNMRHLNFKKLAAITKMGKVRMRLERIAVAVGTLAWNQDGIVGLLGECEKLQEKYKDDPKFQVAMMRERAALHKQLGDTVFSTAKMELMAASSIRKEENRRVKTAKQFTMVIPVIDQEQKEIVDAGLKAQREIEADAARDLPPDGEGQDGTPPADVA